MQLNRTGIGLIGFFLLAGLGFVVAGALAPLPAEARATFVLLGGIWAIVALGLLVFARRQKRRGEHQDWVFRNGIRGRARVLEAGSHTTVNEMPLLKMELELEIPGVGSQRVTRREVMPVFAANRIEAGLVLPAYANPEDPNDFILVW
jgi:hypothetical protein